MKWIGLTGSIASGKSTVSRILKEEFNLPVFSADDIVHELYTQTEVLSKLKESYEDQIFTDGQLDKKKMSQYFFSNKLELKKLENWIHPLVKKEAQNLRKIAQAKGHKMAFYEIPLLFETHQKDQFDFIIGVFCSEALQIERLKKRNHFDEEKSLKILKLQIPSADKKKLCDHVIINESSLEDLKNEVLKVKAHLHALFIKNQN